MNNSQQTAHTNNSNERNEPARAYLKSVRRCTARPDGITEVVHQNGIVERYDIAGRPAGLWRVQAGKHASNVNATRRGDLKALACHRAIYGPTVIKADGITERFAAMQYATPSTAVCQDALRPEVQHRQALAA